MENLRSFIANIEWDSLKAKAGAGFGAAFHSLASRIRPAHPAPDDFATRPEIPAPEEYAAASTAQILDRLYRNPCGLMNEQPFIDTLMNARNAENHRKQTRYLALGFYVLAFAALASVFQSPPGPSTAQIAEQQRQTQQALDNATDLLKQEFNLKLQSKDNEIKDLRRQISQLAQTQGELAKQIKAAAKKAAPAAPPAAKPAKPAPAIPAADKPHAEPAAKKHAP